jgi:hypothetical protein
VRESLREHDERAAESTDEPPAPAEPPAGAGDDEGEPPPGDGGES